MMNAIHVHIEGTTAFFQLVWTKSGTQLTIPCPPYSTLLGLISNCAGRIVGPTDTRIGYEFTSISEGQELERTNRFSNENGRLKIQTKGQSIVRRQIHFRPQLDLYLTNLSLFDAFYNPVGAPVLGRSQDLCVIRKVENVTLTPVSNGLIGQTMIRNEFLSRYESAELVSCVESFDNSDFGMLRKVQSKALFQVIQPGQGNSNQKRKQITADNLYHPSNLPSDNVIYLHEWTTTAATAN
jgi:CRISPR-associated protein Cas5t